MGPSRYILVSALFAVCASQRSPYAGRRPIGYPSLETATVAAATVAPAIVASATAQNDTVGNRFGENSTTVTNVPTTTQRLPVEALGDRDLFNRLGQLPQDKQPFWFLNSQALEANRKQAQSYPLRPNSFVDSFANNDAALNTAQLLQKSQGIPIAQTPIQNNQGVSNSQQPFQNNPGLPSALQPLQNNQGSLNSQPPFQNNPVLPNTQTPFQNSPANNIQQRSGNIPESSEEFDSAFY